MKDPGVTNDLMNLFHGLNRERLANLLPNSRVPQSCGVSQREGPLWESLVEGLWHLGVYGVDYF